MGHKYDLYGRMGADTIEHTEKGIGYLLLAFNSDIVRVLWSDDTLDTYDGLELLDLQRRLSQLPSACECGSSKAGSPGHARYCPLSPR